MVEGKLRYKDLIGQRKCAKLERSCSIALRPFLPRRRQCCHCVSTDRLVEWFRFSGSGQYSPDGLFLPQ